MELTAFFAALDDVPNLRSAHFTDAEMTETAKGYEFDGIAAPTGVPADLGDFTEEYERGVFRRFLATSKDNVPFLHEHNPRDLLATTRSGRLRLSEDGPGLRAKASVVKTDLSERIKSLVDSGDIAGMSIGMVVGRGNSKVEQRDGRPHRTIQGLKKLLDVCTTFDPAYVSTEAQFRSMTMQFAGSTDSLQQILMGAFPQLQVQGNETEGTEEPAPAPAPDGPDGDPLGGGEGVPAGVLEQRSIAARRRALSFLLLNTGDISHET
jgi:HK97 family phage prohead protease